MLLGLLSLKIKIIVIEILRNPRLPIKVIFHFHARLHHTIYDHGKYETVREIPRNPSRFLAVNN